MIEIQTKQLQKALATLELLGCKYAVQDADGTMHGVLVVEVQKTRKHKNPRRDLSKYEFAKTVDPLKVGDVVVYDDLTPEEVVVVRGNISSRGVAKFGKGSFTTMSTDSSVQGMRLS
jgi:hypothetical protein